MAWTYILILVLAAEVAHCLAANSTIPPKSVEKPTARRPAPQGRRIYAHLQAKYDTDGDESEEYICPEGTWMGYAPIILKLSAPYCISDLSKTDKGVGPFGFLREARFRSERNRHTIIGGGFEEIDEIVEERYQYGGIEKNWKRPNFSDITRPETESRGWSNDLLCPWLTAMCSVQYRYYVLTDKDSHGSSRIVFTNIRFGCCDVLTAKLRLSMPHAIRQLTQPDGEPFDESISLYVKLIGPAPQSPLQEKLYFCPPGQFIDQFATDIRFTDLDDINGAGFILTRRKLTVLRSQFFCNDLSKEYPSTPLSRELNADPQFLGEQVNNLGIHKCEDGLFTGVKMDINTRDVWDKQMYCSGTQKWAGGEWEHPNILVRKVNAIDVYRGGEASVSCPRGQAICGVGAKHFQAHKDDVVYVSIEGSSYRYLCCEVPLPERCEDASYKVERISSGCPVTHVNQGTVCTVKTSNGIVRSSSKSGSLKKSETVTTSLGLKITIQIKIITITGKYGVTWKDTESVSWSTGFKDKDSQSEAVATMYTIPAGHRLIIGQPTVRCNGFVVKSEGPVAYYVPPKTCTPRDEYREIRMPYEAMPPKDGGDYNVTLKGTGLGLFGNLYPPEALNVNWEEMTKGISDTFQMNGDLQSHKWTNFDWSKADKALWDEYDPEFRARFLFAIPKNVEPKFYQVIGKCGDWVVNTKDLRMASTSKDFDGRRFVKPKKVFEKEKGKTFI